MSIMDVCRSPRKGRISKNWLKTHGFAEDRWGSPHARTFDSSVFYELQIYARDPEMPECGIEWVGNAMYFPDTFNGYVNFDKCRGFGASRNKVIIFRKYLWNHSNKEYEYFKASNTAELTEALRSLEIDLRAGGLELITDRKIIKKEGLHELT